MTVKERILTIQLLEIIERQPEYAERMDIEVSESKDMSNENEYY